MTFVNSVCVCVCVRGWLSRDGADWLVWIKTRLLSGFTRSLRTNTAWRVGRDTAVRGRGGGAIQPTVTNYMLRPIGRRPCVLLLQLCCGTAVVLLKHVDPSDSDVQLIHHHMTSPNTANPKYHLHQIVWSKFKTSTRKYWSTFNNIFRPLLWIVKFL